METVVVRRAVVRKQKPNVLVIDAGLGNIGSVVTAFERVNCNVERKSGPPPKGMVENYSHVILPGVGSYACGMNALRVTGWDNWIKDEWVKNNKPLLGICLGMQLLASNGNEGVEEERYIEGLNLIPGNISKMENKNNLVLPHVGWNEVKWRDSEHDLTRDLPNGGDFYFVHSYEFKPEKKTDTLGKTDYGKTFVAAVGRGNCIGVQFHPEKSSVNGNQLLKNFIEL